MPFCERCGRNSHDVDRCYAKTNINNEIIQDDPERGVYVLELSGGNFYVGKSENIESRISQHEKDSGASWTKVHPIIGRVDTITQQMDDLESWERAETLELAHKYGIEKVRGHTWTQKILTEQKKNEFISQIRERKDLCRKCGSPDHMISSCRSKEKAPETKSKYNRFKKKAPETKPKYNRFKKKASETTKPKYNKKAPDPESESESESEYEPKRYKPYSYNRYRK